MPCKSHRSGLPGNPPSSQSCCRCEALAPCYPNLGRSESCGKKHVRCPMCKQHGGLGKRTKRNIPSSHLGKSFPFSIHSLHLCHFCPRHRPTSPKIKNRKAPRLPPRPGRRMSKPKRAPARSTTLEVNPAQTSRHARVATSHGYIDRGGRKIERSCESQKETSQRA